MECSTFSSTLDFVLVVFAFGILINEYHNLFKTVIVSSNCDLTHSRHYVETECKQVWMGNEIVLIEETNAHSDTAWLCLLHSLILKLISLTLITLSTATVYPQYVICSRLLLPLSVLHQRHFQSNSTTEANCANSLVWGVGRGGWRENWTINLWDEKVRMFLSFSKESFHQRDCPTLHRTDRKSVV